MFGFVTAVALAAVAARAAEEDSPPPAPPASHPTPSKAVDANDVGTGLSSTPLSTNYSWFGTRPGQPEKGTYLGVNTSPAPAALQKQLQLKSGVGLVVDAVDAASPAEKAGVKQFDILHKIDDQLVINAEQLAVLIRTYPAGKEVKLTVIREGKPQQLTAALAERELPQFHVFFNDFVGAAGGDPVNPLGVIATTAAPATRNAVEQARQIVLSDGVSVRTTVAVPDGGTLLLRTPDGKQELRAARLTIEDDQHRMTLSTRDGRRQLKVQDKSGKVLFDGPIQTKEELEKIPSDLRRTYDELLLEYAKDWKDAKDADNAAQPQTKPAGKK
jgi:hypothetical protein